MEELKINTEREDHLRMLAAAQTLTQDQIDACAWVMGGSGAGWTKQGVIDSLPIVEVVEEDPRMYPSEPEPEDSGYKIIL